MSGDNDEFIILIDENGNEFEAEYIDTIEYRDDSYVVLIPKETHEHADDDCDCEEEVIILKVERDADDDEETLIAIEDEDEQDAVFEIFTQRMEESEYDEEDFDEDDETPPDGSGGNKM